jgi:hypothetical protein
MEQRRVHRLPLEEFKAMKDAPAVEAIAGSLNGGGFIQCHTAVYAATGIWSPELVPVFQKLAVASLTQELPAEIG